MTAPQRSFLSPVAWLFVGYLLAVILFGAWVRISHSGDGCGANWPSCHGELLPSDPATSTRIEFTHRVTSALCGVFGVLLVGWSWRLHGRGPVTTAAGLTLLFIVLEGAIGAGLVLGELTGDNDSAARAVVIALHLGNTLALTAFAALTAWRSSRPMSFGFLPRRRAAFAAGLALFVVTAMTGAVTALGDTLFPQAVSDGGRLVAGFSTESPPATTSSCGCGRSTRPSRSSRPSCCACFSAPSSAETAGRGPPSAWSRARSRSAPSMSRSARRAGFSSSTSRRPRRPGSH